MCDSTECPKEQVLLDYAAGQLGGKERAQFEGHLARCGPCKEALSWVQAHLLRPYQEDPSQGSETGQLPEARTGERATEDLEPPDDTKFDFGLLAPPKNTKSLGRLGKYDIVQVLGQGGMGVVFKAYDEQLRRTVAIKALNRALASSSTARRRFIREARAAAAINHPNVVTIHAVEEHRDLPFLVMEYVGGRSLRDRLRADKRLDPIDTLRLSAQIAAGLAAAHAQGVIHRDVKPSNIMLEDGLERVIITDFGLARAAVDNVELTSRELAVGTPAYMAPEQVAGEKIDARADLFALGCVMYAMLAGHSPFHGKHALDMARKVAEYQPAALDKVNERTPPFLAEIVMRLLEKEPERRYQSAMEVADLLHQHLAVINQTPTDELSRILYGKKRPQRRSSRRWLLPATIVALLLLGIGVSVLYKKVKPEPASSTPADAKADGVKANWLTGEVTVAQSGGARFSSINDALAQAGPGARIVVLDDATYAESIVLDDPQQWNSVTLEAPKQATLTAPQSLRLVTIRNTPGVVIRGFRMELTDNQHAIAILGSCEGLKIEDIEASQPETAPRSLMYLADGASGSAANPISVRNLRLRSGQIGIYAEGSDSGPLRFVRFTNNRISSHHRKVGVLVILRGPMEDVTLANNTFSTGITGISINVDRKQADRVTVCNNTFFDLQHWLFLGDSSLDQGEMAFRCNLILNSDDVYVRGQELSHIASSWFEHNWWHIQPYEGEAKRAQAQLVATWTDNPLVDLDPTSPSFLRPASNSPIIDRSAGLEGGSRIGALDYANEKDSNDPSAR